MQNRITFSNEIGVLLENKKKTYAQYQMIEDIFYNCLGNMDLFEKEIIRQAVDANNGNKSLAAKWLKISRKTLYDKLKKLGLS